MRGPQSVRCDANWLNDALPNKLKTPERKTMAPREKIIEQAMALSVEDRLFVVDTLD